MSVNILKYWLAVTGKASKFNEYAELIIFGIMVIPPY